MKRRIQASETSVIDFDPLCRCGNKAVAYFEIHPLDYCTLDQPTWSKLICSACLTADLQRVQEIILDGPHHCHCGLTIVTLSDMVVRLCPLWAM